MQADTGTNDPPRKEYWSKIISKGISTDASINSYRGLVRISAAAEQARNHSVVTPSLLGTMQAPIPSLTSRSKQVGRCRARGHHIKVGEEELLLHREAYLKMSISLLLNGFCKEVLNQLPLEFSVEAVKLLEMKLEAASANIERTSC